MKHILLIVTICISAIVNAQKTTPKDAWLEKWNNSKEYLIAIAEAMPEDAYDFKPTARQMTFKEQLIHMKGNMEWLSKTYFTNGIYAKNKAIHPKTKAEMIVWLREGFDKTAEIVQEIDEGTLVDTVDFFAGPKSKLQILNLLHDHVTHHRGQLIVYLNLNEVEPPKYTGW